MQTIRQQIIGDAEVGGLITDLLAIPGRIEAAENDLAKATFDLDTYNGVDEAETALKEIEGEIAFEVLNETNGDGKKAFTNAEQRAIEQAKRQHASEEWQNAFRAKQQAFAKKHELTMQVARHRNTVNGLVGRKFCLGHIADIVHGLCTESLTLERTEWITRKASILSAVNETLNKEMSNA